MATPLNNLLRYFAPANLAASLHLRHRRLTLRHVLFTLGLSAALSTVYYVYLRQGEVLFPAQDIGFWPPETPQVWAQRAAEVKQAFQHAYRGYEKHAFPRDELLPISNGSINNFNGWGVTAVDALDTMLLMGLEEEYRRALPMIQQSNFSLPSNTRVPFFETVIRYLGGMLAAYALSGDDLLRDKADELGRILAPAFNTSSGFPAFAVDTYGKRNLTTSTGVLAEIASCQMEYTYLGKITKKKEHVEHATVITNLLHAADLNSSGGMYPTQWNLNTGSPSDHKLSVGALADSGHEYTLKQFLMTARTDRHNLEMYLRLTSYVINNLLYLTPKRHLLYVTDVVKLKRSVVASNMFEHLSCFFPGLLALGAHLLPLDHLHTFGIDVNTLADDLRPADRAAYINLLSDFRLADVHLWAAQGLAQTCYLTYADQPSGLGPEVMRMDVDGEVGSVRWVDALREWKKGDQWWEMDGLGGSSSGRKRGHEKGWGWDLGWNKRVGAPPGVGEAKPWTSPLPGNTTIAVPMVPARVKGKGPDSFGRDYLIKNSAYYLRPETIESFYILWRTTGDVKWRHRGWEVFQAIERHTKTDSGYATVDAVHTSRPSRMNSMPSYFLAETLKYLYLLFSDEDPLPLEKWVFSTEGHAFPVFEWTAQEREAYGIVA